MAGMNEEIFEKVREIVVSQLGVDEAKITSGASFAEDLGADSLDSVELIMAIEQSFEIEIPEDDAEKIVTVQSAVDFIERQAVAR